MVRSFGKFIYALIISILISSCGFKKVSDLAPKVATVSPIAAMLQEEGGCAGEVTPETSELLHEVESFYGEVILYITRYNQAYLKDIVPPSSLGTGDYLLATPLEPMILNTDKLRQEYQDLKGAYEEKLGASFKFKAQKPMEIKGPLLINEESRRLNAVLIKARRLQALSCQRDKLSEREERDVRPYYRLKKENKMEKLCEEVLSVGMCGSERLILMRQGREDDFIKNYEAIFHKKIESFFSFSQKSEWSCVEEGDEKVVRIPIHYDDVFARKINGNLAALNIFVGKKWSGKDFKIVFVAYDKNIHHRKIDIKWSGSHLSFVKDEEPTSIYLSPYLNYDRLLITFAHELGHVFGFPDCYHEFYDREEKSIIYYTLDTTGTHLMCHLDPNATIPAINIITLKNSLCY